MALPKKSGFMKHVSSENHQSAMAQWKEQQHRDSSDTAISTLLNKPDPEHRTWLFTVFSVVKFLVMNSLPLRGDSEMTNFKGEISGGLFLNTFGQCCTYGLKTTLKVLVHVLVILANSYLKIVFSQKSRLYMMSGARRNADRWSQIWKLCGCRRRRCRAGAGSN